MFMNICTAFNLPTLDGKLCEIAITDECIDLFPHAFMGTMEDAGESLRVASEQEKEAIEYLEKLGVEREGWSRDSGGTGLMMWWNVVKEKYNKEEMEKKIKEVYEKLCKSGLEETTPTAA
jgi:hypothetical protein